MAKRNQYNKASLPTVSSMPALDTLDTTLYNTAYGSVLAVAGDVTVPTNTNLYVILQDASTYTASIDIASMLDGQRLDIIVAAEQETILLSASSGAGIIFPSGQANTGSLAAYTMHNFIKLGSVGPSQNVLIKVASSSLGAPTP